MADLATRAGRVAESGINARSGVTRNLATLEHLIADNGLKVPRPETASSQTPPQLPFSWWRAFSLGERSMALAIALTVASMAGAVAWSAKAGLTLLPGQLTAVVWAALLAAAVTLSSAAASRHFDAQKSSAPKLVKRIALRLQLTGAATLLLLLLSITATVLAHLAFGLSDGSDLRDAQFIALDRRLGFDWAAYIDRLNKHAAFGHLLITAHLFAPAMIAAPVLLLGLTYQRRRLAEFICALALATLAAILLTAMLPTAGAYAHLRPDASLFASLNPDASRALTDLINAWHSGPVSAAVGEPGWEPAASTTASAAASKGRAIDPLNVGVALSLPGLQVSLAVLVVYALRRMLVTGIMAAGLCLLIVLSPLNEAGHYLSQHLVGGMIAVGCILFTQVLRIKRRPRPAPVRLRVEREGEFLTWERPAR